MNLPLLKYVMPRPVVLGCYFAADHIAVVRAQRNNGAVKILQALSVPVAWDTVMQEPDQAGATLAAELKKAGIREHRCTAHLPIEAVMYASLALPEMSEADVPSFVELQAEREFPLPLSEISLGHSAFANAEGGRSAMLAAVPTKRLANVRRVLAQARLQPLSITVGIVDLLPQSLPNSLNIVCHQSSMELAVAANGGIAVLRTLAFGGADPVDNLAIARDLKITLGRLPEKVRSSVTTVKLFGSRSAADKVLKATEPTLRSLGFKQFEFAGLKPAGEIVGMIEGEDMAQCVALAGLRRFLLEEKPRFQFLPPAPKPWEPLLAKMGTGRSRYAVGVPVAVAVILFAAAYIHSQMLANLEEDYKDIKPEVDRLEQVQERIRFFRPWMEQSSVSLDVLKCLSEAFPEDKNVWVKSVEFKDGDKVICTGFARTTQGVLDVVSRLQKRPEVRDVTNVSMRGDKPVQFSFTFIWSKKYGS